MVTERKSKEKTMLHGQPITKRVVGLSTMICNDDEMNQITAKIPELMKGEQKEEKEEDGGKDVIPESCMMHKFLFCLGCSRAVMITGKLSSQGDSVGSNPRPPCRSRSRAPPRCC